MFYLLNRDDGKDALKIYTDPDYFFNLWREAMTKEVRDAKEKRREQRRRDVSFTFNCCSKMFSLMNILCSYHRRTNLRWDFMVSKPRCYRIQFSSIDPV